MLSKRVLGIALAHDSPVAVFIRARVVELADELEETASKAADRVPGSQLADWSGPEVPARLVGHLRALAWNCRMASACIVGEIE